MSAKEVERIARTPQDASAQGACSRDEPAPKLSPTSRIWRPAISGRSSTNGGSLSEPSSSNRQSRKRASARPALSVTLRYRAGTIWSVSTFSAGIGTTRLWTIENGSATSATADAGQRLDPGQPARVGHDAGQRARSGRQRGGEERPAALALAALEVPVAGA